MKKEIEIRPEFIYWVGVNFGLFVLTIGILLSTIIFPIPNFLNLVMLFMIFIFTILMIYNYFNILKCTIWIVTEQQIIKKTGVFAKRVDYLELYRVYDYEERKNFIQNLFNNTNVFIYSGDKSTPVLKIYGIKANTDIIDVIRKRVELERKTKQVFELTNRN